jgi:hypothetical protein
MPFLAKPYKSEITEFLDSLKAKDPELEARQREGRELLWDKKVDPDAVKAAEESRVPQQAYVYGVKSSQR